MGTSAKRVGFAALAGAAAMGLAVSHAQGQGYANVGRPLAGFDPYFQIRPGLNVQQAAYNTTVMGRAFANVPPYALGFNPYGPTIPPGLTNPALLANPNAGLNPYASAAFASNPYSSSAAANPYGGYTSSTGSYGESPEGGYLRGAADVINSQGRFLVSVQQANSLKEKVRQERLENQRRVFDEWLYEREKGPTWEEERQRYIKQVLNRSLNDPPETEVWAGTSLNYILNDLQKKMGKDKTNQGPQIPVDEEVLRHINLTSGVGGGNAGLLKNDGRLSWPLALHGAEYKQEREKLNDLTAEVINQAINGRVDAGTLKAIIDGVDRLRQDLVANVKDLPPNQYMESKRFLSSFDDAIKVLRQPNAGDYFTQKFAAKGKNVGELVKYMTEKGLKFAPAVAGDEAAYTALQRAMAAYDSTPQLTTSER